MYTESTPEYSCNCLSYVNGAAPPPEDSESSPLYCVQESDNACSPYADCNGVRTNFDYPCVEAPYGVADEIKHFQQSMFNHCCASKGFTQEINGNLTVCSYDNLWGDPTGLGPIQSCYTREELYYAYDNIVDKVADQFICPILTQATVNVRGVLVPGTSFEVSAFTDGEDDAPGRRRLARPDVRVRHRVRPRLSGRHDSVVRSILETSRKGRCDFGRLSASRAHRGSWGLCAVSPRRRGPARRRLLSDTSDT